MLCPIRWIFTFFPIIQSTQISNLCHQSSLSFSLKMLRYLKTLTIWIRKPHRIMFYSDTHHVNRVFIYSKLANYLQRKIKCPNLMPRDGAPSTTL